MNEFDNIKSATQPPTKLQEPTTVNTPRKSSIIATLSLAFALILAIGTVCFLLGYKKTKKIAVDFSMTEITSTEDWTYTILPKEISDYICELSSKMNLNPDLVVAILLVENPELDPEAVSKPNSNGTLDLGLFQLNDKYLWTTFVPRYWFDNIELDPFNWKHNTYIAMHHLQYLQETVKYQDDVIMAYNAGENAVMNNTVKPSTKAYLAKVKNNLKLLEKGDIDVQ